MRSNSSLNTSLVTKNIHQIKKTEQQAKRPMSRLSLLQSQYTIFHAEGGQVSLIYWTSTED